MKRHILCASLLLGSMLFSSCYFNSAGYIFDKASYRANVDPADLKPGDVVYVRGDEYYIELPRHRFGNPVQLQMNMFSQGRQLLPSRQRVADNAVDMFRIPPDYARYLLGESSGVVEPSFFMRVDDADVIKSTATASRVINQVPPSFPYQYKHTSSAAALWYTLGVFDWLCVDLPITCVENSLALCGGFIVCVFDTPDQAVESDLPNGGLQRLPIMHNVIKRDLKAQQDEWYRQKEMRCSP